MAVDLTGTAATTGFVSDTSGPFSLNLPSGITSGEALVICVLLNQDSKTFSITGWDNDYNYDNGGRVLQLFTRTADGGEGSTVAPTINSGSSGYTSIACRLTGVDNDDKTPNTDNRATGAMANSATPSLAANTLTGMTSGNAILMFLATEANRTVNTYDSDFETEIGQVNDTNSMMLYLDNNPGTANPLYDFTLSSSRAMDYMIMEIGAAAVGGATGKANPMNGPLGGPIAGPIGM